MNHILKSYFLRIICALLGVIGFSFTVADPFSGKINPPTTLTDVVLPAPLGPNITNPLFFRDLKTYILKNLKTSC